MTFWEWIQSWRKSWRRLPLHLKRGRLGEHAARRFLERQGMQFLLANFRSDRGEIDLIFRHEDCLVFVEVKTRSSEEWTRPSRAVDHEKRRKISLCAHDYLRLLRQPRLKLRCDIVEVLLGEGGVREVRHLPNAFRMERRYY